MALPIIPSSSIRSCRVGFPVLPCLLLLLRRRGNVHAQVPLEYHPYFYDCPEPYACGVGYYCSATHERGLCLQCPGHKGIGSTTEDCKMAVELTMEKISSTQQVKSTTNNATSNFEVSLDLDLLMDKDLSHCLASCVRRKEGEDCSDDSNPCNDGTVFCNYNHTTTTNDDSSSSIEDGSMMSKTITTSMSGVCQPCKEDRMECLNDDAISHPFAQEECLMCRQWCNDLHFSVTKVSVNLDEEEEEEDQAVMYDTIANKTYDRLYHDYYLIDSLGISGSPEMDAVGPLLECSNLIHKEETTCSPNAKDDDTNNNNNNNNIQTVQEGFICLVDTSFESVSGYTVINKCAALGGVGVIIYGDFSLEGDPNDEPWMASTAWEETNIPSVTISYNNGKVLKEKITNQLETEVVMAQINVTDAGSLCLKRLICSEEIPCLGSNAGKYCDFQIPGGDRMGRCRDCPVDEVTGEPQPLACFFKIDNATATYKGQKAVESCATVCGYSLTFPKCKFCPSNMDQFDFSSSDDVDNPNNRCDFCSENDVQFPDKEFPLFGEGIKCWQIQKFFKGVAVKPHSTNCRLARMMNYVCGCSGPGYAGASSDTKKKVLAWLPRVMALLSLMGSSFIIYDITKTPAERQKVKNQLLIGLSIFDIFGSCAYALTTLPIPKDDPYGPIYGAKGNDATCTVQGFFVQMGTISAFMNVSLGVYYFLVITRGWHESQIKKVRWILFLCPLLVGFTFAFAGIAFYGNLVLWCNNTAPYWPDIPVAIAIGTATVIMGIICWEVYKKDQASRKWRIATAIPDNLPDDGSLASQSSKVSRISGISRGTNKSNKSNRSTASGRQRASLSSIVFWQSWWYLMSFYLTWPPYLALQYAWASGKAFTNYGLILTAGMLVPLQGFWNMIVYVRQNAKRRPQNPSGQRQVTVTTRTTVTSTGSRRMTARLSNLFISRKNLGNNSSQTTNA